MDLRTKLFDRSGGKCELCQSHDKLEVFNLSSEDIVDEQHAVLICYNCQLQINNPQQTDISSWQCLSKSMWSEHSAVQKLTFQILQKYKDQPWAASLLDQMSIDLD